MRTGRQGPVNAASNACALPPSNTKTAVSAARKTMCRSRPLFERIERRTELDQLLGLLVRAGPKRCDHCDTLHRSSFGSGSVPHRCRRRWRRHRRARRSAGGELRIRAAERRPAGPLRAGTRPEGRAQRRGVCSRTGRRAPRRSRAAVLPRGRRRHRSRTSPAACPAATPAALCVKVTASSGRTPRRRQATSRRSGAGRARSPSARMTSASTRSSTSVASPASSSIGSVLALADTTARASPA